MTDFVRKPYLSYLRVSSDDQRERETIATQEQQHRLWYSRHDIDPDTQVHWVLDDGVSGSIRIWKRPGGQLVEELIEKGFVTEAVLMYMVNRANRDDVASWFLLTGLCEEYGLKVLTIRDGVDTSTPEGYFMGGMNAMYARSTKQQQIQIMRDGKVRGAGKGIWQASHSKKPYGLRVNSESRLEIEPTEQIVLYRIRDLLGQGHSVRRVCTILNTENIPTPYGAKAWVHCTVTRVMSNPAIMGKARFNHTRSRTRGGKKQTTDRPTTEHVYIDCPATFTEAEYNQIQEWLTRNRAKYHADGSHRTHVFVNSVKCASCGGKYYPSMKRGVKNTHADWIYYRHAWHSEKLKSCPYVKVTLNAKWVEPTAWDSVLAAVSDVDAWLITASTQAPDLNFDTEIALAESVVIDIENSLDELELAFFERKTIAPERYDNRQKRLSTRLEAANRHLASLRRRATDTAAAQHRVHTLAEQLRELAGIVRNATTDEKRRICDVVLDSVEAHFVPERRLVVKWRL